MAPTEMQDHIDRLLEAAEAGRPPDDALLVHCVEDRNEACLIDDNELHLPFIRGARDYATVLNEIGHLRGRYQRSKKVMTRERWAWRWARRTALAWTEEMEDEANASLAWYASRA
jgi:hypothetical protein